MVSPPDTERIDTGSSRVRVAVMSTHPIQYQAPLWRHLAARPELALHVFFGSDLSVRGYRDVDFGVNVKWDIPLTEGYAHTFLGRDRALQRIGFWQPRARGLGLHLEQLRPAVALLTAYGSLFWIGGFLAARMQGIPVVLRHEASDVAETRSPLKGFVRDLLLRAFYSQVAGFAAIGTEARRHLLRLGVPAARIGWAPYCVDSEQIERQVQEWRPRREDIRQSLGMATGDCVLIFSGKLIAKKQPLMIAQAIALLPEKLRARTHLIVMGDGELRASLDSAARPALGARLHMAGFVNQSEMGRWYAAADCLVLPSKTGAGETWGLVVNEALQFGLPAIVSDGVGCHPDLITSLTGRVFDSASVQGLAGAIASVEEGLRAQRTAWFEACRQKAGEFSLQVAARGLAEVLLATARIPAGNT